MPATAQMLRSGLTEPALMQGSSLPANIKSITNSRDPHFLEAEDGRPRTQSTDAGGANCDGSPPCRWSRWRKAEVSTRPIRAIRHPFQHDARYLPRSVA